jgi:cysteine desulfuration protein SufE
MNSIRQIQDEVIAEFGLFDDWMAKYEYIIELGNSLPEMELSLKTDDNLVRGCQSRVWMHAMQHDGLVHYTADSDAIITKGLVALVLRVLSGHTAEEISTSELYFVDQIGLNQHLSQTRANGLAAMIRQMKMYALAFSAHQNQP